jgi:hypothetical protein
VNCAAKGKATSAAILGRIGKIAVDHGPERIAARILTRVGSRGILVAA